MTHYTLLLLAYFSCMFTHAQPPGKTAKPGSDSLFTTSGYNVAIGKTIQLAKGTGINNGFEYVMEGSEFNPEWFMNRNHEDVNPTWTICFKKVKIVEIKSIGTKKNTLKYFVKFAYNNVLYWCDIDNAIKSGEVLTEKAE